jgi:hypothetical protein
VCVHARRAEPSRERGQHEGGFKLIKSKVLKSFLYRSWSPYSESEQLPPLGRLELVMVSSKSRDLPPLSGYPMYAKFLTVRKLLDIDRDSDGGTEVSDAEVEYDADAEWVDEFAEIEDPEELYEVEEVESSLEDDRTEEPDLSFISVEYTE